jgi:hypothetical protein
MRQGNEFTMPLDRDYKYPYSPSINVPYEVMMEFEDAKFVTWISNGDGTFTLRLHKSP